MGSWQITLDRLTNVKKKLLAAMALQVHRLRTHFAIYPVRVSWVQVTNWATAVGGNPLSAVVGVNLVLARLGGQSEVLVAINLEVRVRANGWAC